MKRRRRQRRRRRKAASDGCDGASAGVSETECKCGCENLLPLTVYNRGWRYLRGHKGYRAGESAGGKQARIAAKREKPWPVTETSYARTLEMVNENMRSAMAAYEEYSATQARLIRECGLVCEKISLIGCEVEKLEKLRTALVPFVPGAEHAQESETA